MENDLNNYMQKNERGHAYQNADEQIDLRELFSAIWQGKWIIITITFLFTVVSVFYAINQPNIYKSEALLAPAEQEKNGGLGGLAGQFGGLASLAGVNLGGISSNKSELAIEILKSRQFTSEFIKKHNLLPYLLAVDSWELESNTLNFNTEIYNPDTNTWVRDVKAPKKPEPSMQEAYKEFREIITLNTDKETGMLRLSIQHKSPVIAQQWVNWLINDINSEMKKRDVAEANKSTEFLTKQLEKTKIADIRTMLFKLIEEQTKTIMFANVRDEYVFKTIDPALVPEEKSGPKRALICILGMFLGGILSIVFTLLMYFSRRKLT
ncbi:Wzz/FepE/Etk N-terminal domain-containing protein [Pseudoalteromonas sp. 1_2015MBL_MicDiv]|uniref:Wzz/FepE/Etk N-terminal domain-containing protein n=1 Tax=Pseudoalteromonas sp. 1_2015MBL_MicDiv TaxID=1720343 RepID=UPI000BBEED9E|nr:Wzz/FepE/Etk N-terminal domain-containing protein [Pseudoalteromonas sp. 1_2015MBL_MicDiv]ATG76472.1 lipopolysaccharide biosynthesis protein [Pseudoalteromonas sp. 1_2015MBL_MicDiv]